jgi:hypothetical protein
MITGSEFSIRRLPSRQGLCSWQLSPQNKGSLFELFYLSPHRAEQLAVVAEPGLPDHNCQICGGGRRRFCTKPERPLF